LLTNLTVKLNEPSHLLMSSNILPTHNLSLRISQRRFKPMVDFEEMEFYFGILFPNDRNVTNC
jgi:hypothetical protein